MLSNLPQYVAYTRKAIINVLGLLTSLLALGLLPDQYNKWVSGAIALLTAVSHFMTPNAEAPGSGPATEEFAPEDVEEDVPAEWQPSEVVTASQVSVKNEQQANPPSPS